LELLQALFLPLFFSPLVYLLNKKVKITVLTFSVLLYSTILIILKGEGVESFSWKPLGNFGLKLDGLSYPFALLITLVGCLLSLYSLPYMVKKEGGLDKRIGLYYSLYLLTVSGMLGSVLATNLIQFYIFFELMLLPAFFLISEFGYRERERVGLIFFIWTHAGALILLLALIVTGLYAKGFDYDDVLRASIPEDVKFILASFIILGLMFKLSAFGLHLWAPYTYAEAPTPISALISSVMTGIGGYALIRILAFLLPTAYSLSLTILGVWALITMIYGSLLALKQTDIKKILAYSSISQMGYIIFGIASGSHFGLSGSTLFYVSGGLGKALLFMAFGVIILQTNIRDMDKLGGLAKNLPITAIASMVGFLTLMGVPPTVGFQAEWLLFLGAFQAPLQTNDYFRLILAYLALTSTILTTAYSLNTMRKIFFGPRPQELKEVKEAPLIIVIPILIITLLTLLFGIYPNLFTDKLLPLTYHMLR